MNAEAILAGIGIAFAFAAVLGIIYFFLRLLQFAKNFRAAIEDLTNAVKGSHESLALVSMNTQHLPGMMEAIGKVGHAQLEIMRGQQAQQGPFGRNTNALSARDVASADQEYEISMMMKQGMTREQAMFELNGANTGVTQPVRATDWSGKNLLSGW